jgi:hypothetical protein
MVCGLLGTASTRIVVNGIACALIFNRRDLRQGTPALLLGHGYASPDDREGRGGGPLLGPCYFGS